MATPVPPAWSVPNCPRDAAGTGRDDAVVTRPRLGRHVARLAVDVALLTTAALAAEAPCRPDQRATRTRQNSDTRRAVAARSLDAYAVGDLP